MKRRFNGRSGSYWVVSWGSIHGGSDGGFLEEAVEGLFGGAVRGLLEVHGIKGFTKKL